MRWLSLFLACQHLNSGTNLRECEDQIWFKVQAVPVFRFDWRKMCPLTLRLDTTAVDNPDRTGCVWYWHPQPSLEAQVCSPVSGSCSRSCRFLRRLRALRWRFCGPLFRRLHGHDEQRQLRKGGVQPEGRMSTVLTFHDAATDTESSFRAVSCLCVRNWVQEEEDGPTERQPWATERPRVLCDCYSQTQHQQSLLRQRPQVTTYFIFIWSRYDQRHGDSLVCRTAISAHRR
jgi:hypothetical protein